MPTEIVPATPERWSDLEALFGPRGACGGCWCMAWRVSPAEFKQIKGDGARHALHALVDRGPAPGLLAYVDGQPAGWCAVAPRPEFTRLEKSRILSPPDDKPVWSVTCFVVAKPFRKRGLTVELLRGAVEFARSQGAQIVEGYPFEVAKELPGPFVWTGLASAFRKAGFLEVARRSPTRPIMRCTL